MPEMVRSSNDSKPSTGQHIVQSLDAVKSLHASLDESVQLLPYGG